MKLRVKIGLFLMFIIASIVITIRYTRGVGFREGYAPKQPINFSHKVHAGDNQMQCMYCHFAADKGRHAGIPPTELCMNCHTKVQAKAPEIVKLKELISSGKNVKWTRVHNLPDYAYFNHSQHVKVGKISCQSCHGEVQAMAILKQEKAMNMGWCLDCHRQNNIAPPKDHKSQNGGNCASCHY